MTKPQFEYIVDLIKDHSMFRTTGRKRQVLVSVQLKIALHRLIHDGFLSSFNTLDRLLGVSVGSVIRYTTWCTSALCAYIIEFIKWPIEDEKVVIKEHLDRIFSDVIGVVHDTMIPDFRAPAFGRDSFATRKSGVSEPSGVSIAGREVGTSIKSTIKVFGAITASGVFVVHLLLVRPAPACEAFCSCNLMDDSCEV
ncbi:MAG: hypothetical protein J3R72DRAFT_508070 [Linnemannia gamsii]|nr:MAG: hypothetical protein J3R72DRAFT_508070 [Linnemannia gamsii]